MRSTVVELRRYVLQPGARDTLIELFDREFVETQEAVGMYVLGTFTDLDDPDAFVWLRGFPNLAGRAPSLEEFYSGPVWAEHRDAANATMIDSDNVLLLRPLDEVSQLDLDMRRRPVVGAPPRDGLLTVTISPVELDLEGDVVARFTTEHAKNDFPALPVREDVDVFVYLTRGPIDPPAGAEVLRLAPTPRSLLP